MARFRFSFGPVQVRTADRFKFQGGLEQDPVFPSNLKPTYAEFRGALRERARARSRQRRAREGGAMVLHPLFGIPPPPSAGRVRARERARTR